MVGGVNKRTIAGCGRLRQAAAGCRGCRGCIRLRQAAAGCGRLQHLGDFGTFLDVFTCFLSEIGGAPRKMFALWGRCRKVLTQKSEISQNIALKNGENTPIGSIFTIYTRGCAILWPGCGRLRQAAEAAEAAAGCSRLQQAAAGCGRLRQAAAVQSGLPHADRPNHVLTQLT